MTTSISNNKIVSRTGLTFDDVLLIPRYSPFKRSDISLKTKITKRISIDLPFISSPMDTVTESRMAIALANLGGIGIVHRNLSIENQAMEVKKVLDLGLKVGAAVGAGQGFEKRVEALSKVGLKLVVVDSAHGYAKGVIDAIKHIKHLYPDIDIIGGNIATFEGAEALIQAGADGLRVGMGPGAICTTRIISGMGVPQITALLETAKAATKKNIPFIADGGIKYSGDMMKAIAAGASAVMMGSFFASCEESPGEVVEFTTEQVPARFKSILKKNLKSYKFKSYRGMGSIGAMKAGAKIKSEDEYHGKNYSDRTLVAEGVEGFVPVHGTVEGAIEQAVGGIKSGMFYVGAMDIPSLHKTAQFMQITQASLKESHPHDIFVTDGGENYHH